MLEFHPMCFFINSCLILSSWYFVFSDGEGYIQATPMHNHSYQCQERLKGGKLRSWVRRVRPHPCGQWVEHKQEIFLLFPIISTSFIELNLPSLLCSK